MARRADIDTIGKEAFDILDEYDRRNGRPPYRHHVDRRSQVPQMKEVDRRRQVSQMKEAVVLDCYEAAKMYGGVVVRDGRQKRPSMWSFYF